MAARHSYWHPIHVISSGYAYIIFCTNPTHSFMVAWLPFVTNMSTRATNFHIFDGLGTIIGDYTAATYVHSCRSRLVGLVCSVYIIILGVEKETLCTRICRQ